MQGIIFELLLVLLFGISFHLVSVCAFWWIQTNCPALNTWTELCIAENAKATLNNKLKYIFYYILQIPFACMPFEHLFQWKCIHIRFATKWQNAWYLFASLIEYWMLPVCICTKLFSRVCFCSFLCANSYH